MPEPVGLVRSVVEVVLVHSAEARVRPVHSALQAQVPSARHQRPPSLRMCSAVVERRAQRHQPASHLRRLPSVPLLRMTLRARSRLGDQRLLRAPRLPERLLVEGSSSTLVLLPLPLRLVEHRRRRRLRLEGLRSLLGMGRRRGRGLVSGRSEMKDSHTMVFRDAVGRTHVSRRLGRDGWGRSRSRVK